MIFFQENIFPPRMVLAITGALMAHIAIFIPWANNYNTQAIAPGLMVSDSMSISLNLTGKAREIQKTEPEITIVPKPSPIAKKEEVTEKTEEIKSIPVVKNAEITGNRIPPVYPKRALRLGQQGVVLLHIFVSENGHSGEVKIIKSSGFALLDRAAIEAVSKWRFAPYIYNGTQAASWVEVPVEFALNGAG